MANNKVTAYRRFMGQGVWTETFDIETDLEVGEEVWLINGILKITIEHDSHYGADADGNRGISVTGESHRSWKLMSAANYSDLEKEWHNDNIPTRVQIAADKWAENYQPDFEDEGRDE